MIRSLVELEETLREFEYSEPSPLSTVPSAALRQAVMDVEYITARGAVIDMDDYVRVNGGCETCFAGAVMLARGMCQQSAATAFDERRNCGADYFDLAPYTLFAGGGRRELLLAFNDARLGCFEKLLKRGGMDTEAAHLLQQSLTAKFGCRPYVGRLDPIDVKLFCEHMREIADYLEKAGW
jgi:hypothetical protein